MIRNIGSNWMLALIQLVVLIQLTPVQVHALGAPAQGAWLTIASLTSLLGLMILGVPMASVRFITGHVARREIDEANRAIATCLAVTLGLGAVALGVGAACSVFFEHTYLRSAAWQTLGPGVLREARVAYWIVVVQVALGFAGQLPFGIPEAHHDFLARNGVKIAGLFLRLVLVVAVLRHYPSLIVLGVVQLSVMLLELAVALAFIRRNHPEIRFGLRGLDRTRLRSILGFSVFVMLGNMGSQLAFQSDQMVINAVRGPEQGTLFDVGNKFFPPLVGIVLGIGMVMMPTATKLQVTGQMDELRHVFLKWSKVAVSIGLLAAVFLLVLAPQFIGWWMGPAFVGDSSRIARVLAVAFVFFLPARGVASPMLMGLGKPVLPAVALLAMGVINLALSLALVRPFGIVGVAVGTAVPAVIFAGTVVYIACGEVGVPFGDYLRYVLVRPAVGALAPALLLVALQRVAHLFPAGLGRTELFLRLAAAGGGMAVAFAATWLLFVYRADPYFDLGARVGRFLPSALRSRAQ
jgi:O-antigen/teichoic acid export membrane protein